MRVGNFLVLACVAPGVAFAGGFKASSSQKDAKNPGIWDAASALDGNAETCWKVDPDVDSNVGQFIEVNIPASSVDKIAIIAGWDKDEATFKDYPRVKSARVEVFQGDQKVGEGVIAPEDKRGWQVLDVPDAKVEGAGGVVRITVQEIYPGADFPNLALSDVRIHLGEFEAGSLKVVEPASGTEALTDKNPKTVYNGTLDTPLLLSANGYGLASVGLQAGATGRPKTVQITANDNTQTITLADKPEMQWFTLPVLVGYTGSSWGRIGVKVVDTYGGAGFSLAGVALNAATIEEF